MFCIMLMFMLSSSDELQTIKMYAFSRSDEELSTNILDM